MLHKKSDKVHFRVCGSGDSGCTICGKQGSQEGKSVLLGDSLGKHRSHCSVCPLLLLRNPQSSSCQNGNTGLDQVYLEMRVPASSASVPVMCEWPGAGH